LVGPPADLHPAPLGDEARVVAFLLGQGAHGVGKGQGVREVPEGKGAHQLADAVFLDELPVGDLRFQLGHLPSGHRRGVGAAGHALFRRQVAHGASLLAGPLLALGAGGRWHVSFTLRRPAGEFLWGGGLFWAGRGAGTRAAPATGGRCPRIGTKLTTLATARPLVYDAVTGNRQLKLTQVPSSEG